MLFVTAKLAFSDNIPTPAEVEQSLRPHIPSLETKPPEPLFEPPRQERPAPVSDERRIPVKSFEFIGNTVFSDDELRQVLSDWQGHELTLTEIYQLSDLLTDYYQSRGYSLSTVTVPAQRMRGGVLQLEVVEGRVGKLLFSGNKRYNDRFLTRQLDQLSPGTIIRFADLEQEALLLNDLPGLVARTTLSPGEDYGTSDIQFNLKEQSVSARATLDNHGSTSIGKWRAATDFTINNPFRIGDALNLAYTHSESGLLRQYRLGYSLPVHRSGSRLAINYSRADYDVGGLQLGQGAGISGLSESARVLVSYPWIRSRTRNLSVNSGLAYVRGSSDFEILGATLPIVDNKIVVFEAGISYSNRHANGSNSSLSGQLSSNLRDNSAGDRQDSLPIKLELDASHEVPFARFWSVFVRGGGAWSYQPLPSSHKFSLGGSNSVRAFNSSAVQGDYGLLGSLELRRVIPADRLTMQARAFVDGGWAGNHPWGNTGRSSGSLSGAGLGMLFFFADRVMLDAQWSHSLDGKYSGDGGKSRFWVLLSVGF